MTKPKPSKGIDDHLATHETFVGLAKEAAKSPLPRADVDIDYYLSLAQQRGGPAIAERERNNIWELFRAAQPERIKRVEGVIERYRKDPSEHARAQIAWYEQELARLKQWRPPRT